MQQRLTLVLTLALAAHLASTPVRADLPFDQLLVFGASYDDNGQLPDPSFAYKTGLRFTNIDPATGQRGRSMPEWLASNLGLGELTPSMPITIFGARTDTVDTDNINFAVGGYRSEDVLQSIIGTQQVSIAGLTFNAPGFLQRVAAGNLSVSPDALFYALPAGNDIRDLDDPADTARISARIVRALVDAGARYIVLPTLPKLGSFAERSNHDANGRTALGEGRTAGAVAFNTAFEQELERIGGNFIRIDVTTLFDEVLADPAAFGYPTDIDQTRSCLDARAVGGPGCEEPAGRGASSGGNPDDFVFNDGLHPTQAAARAAADLMTSVILAPGQFALVPEVLLGEARAFQNTLDGHFQQTRWDSADSGWRLFSSVQDQNLDIANAAATPAADSDSTDLTIGVDRGLGNGWVLGAALGSQSADADTANTEFSTDGLMLSVFATLRCKDWFADFSVSGGRADVNDIERTVPIGPVLVRHESGDTEADIMAASADVGVDMTAEGTPLRFGPFLGLEYVSVDVDAYAESGASSSAMAFDDYERESLIGRAGVFASYPLSIGSVTLDLHADVAYFEEFEDDTDAVVAVNRNLSSGPRFRMPGYAIDDNGIRASVGVHGVWASGLRVGLGYRYDDNEAEADYIRLNASYAF